MPKDCLPEKLRIGPNSKHLDWVFFLRWVPRWWFAKCGPNWPMPPKRVWGGSHLCNHEPRHLGMNGAECPNWVKPIPQPGHYILSAVMYRNWLPLLYFAKKWKDGQFFYIGTRWDDVQNEEQPNQYYELFLIRAHGWKGIAALLGILAVVVGVVYYVAL